MNLKSNSITALIIFILAFNGVAVANSAKKWDFRVLNKNCALTDFTINNVQPASCKVNDMMCQHFSGHKDHEFFDTSSKSTGAK